MSLFSQLEEIQWKQLQHDEKYHKDIWLLNVQQRITHMVLHLSKYSTKITLSVFEKDHKELEKTLIDALIITVSSFNIFNTLISQSALSNDFHQLNTIDDLSNNLYQRHQAENIDNAIQLSIKLASEVGKMCKAVESLDHLESFNYKETIIDCLSKSFLTLLVLAKSNNIVELASLIENRLYEVEKKNIFFNRLGNYKSGY